MWKEITLSGFADEIDEKLSEQIRVLRKLGMSYLEMRGVNGKGLVEYSIEEVKEIKKFVSPQRMFRPAQATGA